MRPRFGPLVLALLLSAPGLSWADPAPAVAGGLSPLLPSAAPPPASPAATDATDRAVISRALEEVEADRRRMASGQLPASATAQQEEILERNRQIEQLAAVLTRHLDLVDRLPAMEALGRARRTELESWRDFGHPPPYSILFVDQLHTAYDTAIAERDNARTRRDWAEGEQGEGEKRYKTYSAQERQIEERLATLSAGPARDRQAWLRDLARLQARVAAEDIAEAGAQKALATAEISARQAEVDLLARQMARARQSMAFSEADLETMLAGIDRQRSLLEARAKSLIAAGPAIRDGLTQAEAAEQAAEQLPDDGSRSQKVAQARAALSLARLQSDNHDLAVDLNRRMLELKALERTGWQYRWLFINSGDVAKQREAAAELHKRIERLDEWSRYIAAQLALAAGQLGDDAPAPGGQAGSSDLTVKLLAARRERADLYRDGQQAVESLRRIFTVWEEEFQDGQRANGSLSSWLTVSWQLLRQGVTAFWDFELFTAEDSIDIDGHQVMAKRSVTVGKSIGAVLLVLLGYLLSNAALGGLRRVAVRYFGIEAGHTQTMLRWAHFVILSMLFIIALYLVNIPLTVFAFLGGALAIGVGFGTQVLLKNLISGIMLLVERPLRVGDLVEVGSVVGTVTNISIRSSTVRTSDGIEILVPNSTFVENNVTNWTYSNARVRRNITIGVGYGARPAAVETILLKVAGDHPFVVRDPAPRVLLDDFGPDALIFKLQYWIDYADGADGSLIASQLRIAMESALTRADIDIPLPQRVIHIKKADAGEPA